MKRKNNYLVILLLIFITSCVSIKPARNIEKAENRIIKLNTGIKNQVDAFPQLADKAWKVIVKDTVVINPDSAKFKATLLDLEYLKKLNSEYEEIIGKSNITIDSLLSLPIKDYPVECEPIVNELRNRIARLGTEFNLQKNETQLWRSRYNEYVLDTVSGTYTDDRFIVDYTYSNGEIEISPKTKPNYIIVDKEEYNYNVKIRKQFWQDPKFYLLSAGILVILYFFGGALQSILRNTIGKLITLIRKLIFKI